MEDKDGIQKKGREALGKVSHCRSEGIDFVDHATDPPDSHGIENCFQPVKKRLNKTSRPDAKKATKREAYGHIYQVVV